MNPSPRRWIGKNRALLANSGSMIGASLATSVLGFAYWWLATRLFPTTAVGLAAVAASMMQLVAQFGVLGFGTLLSGELSRRPQQRVPLVVSALIVTMLSTSVLGLLFVISVPHFIPNLRPLDGGIGSAAVFILGVSVAGIASILDAAVVGLLRAHLSLWRNILLGVSKLVLLLVLGRYFAGSGWLAIYGAWVAALALSCLGLVALLRPKRRWLRRLGPHWRSMRGLGRSALGHHVLNQALWLTSFGMPLLVTGLLSAATNAYYNISWQIAGLASLALTAITSVLYVIGSGDRAALARKIHTTLILCLVGGVVAAGVLFVGARLILSIYPPDYARHATWSLRFFSLSVFPLIIKTHFVTIRRLDGLAVRTALPIAAGGVLELGLAAVGARVDGLTGLSLGWLGALCLEAALMAGTVYRAARRSDGPEGSQAGVA